MEYYFVNFNKLKKKRCGSALFCFAFPRGRGKQMSIMLESFNNIITSLLQ